MIGTKTYDIIIVGGGVIGLSIARELRKTGHDSILLLDKGKVGREASWAAAGILAPQVEADEDGDFFRLCYESNKMYPQSAAELLDETGIDVEFDRRGILYVGFDSRDEEEFERRFKWQSAAGLSVERLDPGQIKELEPDISDKVTCGLLFPDDGQVENRKLVEALAAYARNNDIGIQEDVEIIGILTEHGRVQGVETKHGRITSGNVVIATGAWTSFITVGKDALPVEVKPIRGQMISYRPKIVKVRHVVYSQRGYLVPRADGRLLAGATVEDVGFDTSTTADAKAALREIAVEIVPQLSEMEIADHWAGLRPYADGGLPYIGPVKDVGGLFAAVGHFRNGILLAPITARMIAGSLAGANATTSTVTS